MSFNLDPWWKRSVPSVCLLLCLLAGISLTQTASNKPVKLAVQTPDSAVIAGARVEIEVVLWNTNNRAVKAPKDFLIGLEIRQPSGKVETMSAVIKTGETATRFRTQLNEPGLVGIRAKHRELLEGSAFISVRSPSPKPRPTAFSTTPSFFARGIGFRFDRGAPMLQLASMRPTQSRPPLLAGSEGSHIPLLTLCCSSQRRFLADGKDEAKILLFLEEPTPAELQIRLTSSGGRLTPEVVVIRPRQSSGEARLTNDQPGAVTVNVQSLMPKAELVGARKLELSFAPPITKLDLMASPPKIYQGDRSDLIVQLKDERDRLVKTDELRQISLSIESGRGEVEPKVIAIRPGHFEGRARFTPASSGTVVIAAWTESLAADREELQIDRSTTLLIWSGIGGLLGGLLAFWSRSLKWWRLPMGAITSQVFYWSFTFGALPLLPSAVVVNAWSAFAISVIGGWLGTEVFSLILRRVGLSPANVKAVEKLD